MLEDTIENFLVAEVKARGGFAVKLNPAGYKGIPDRLVILPGRIAFVELKRPRGGVVARLQAWWHQQLRDLGHEVAVLLTREGVIEFLRDRR